MGDGGAVDGDRHRLAGQRQATSDRDGIDQPGRTGESEIDRTADGTFHAEMFTAESGAVGYRAVNMDARTPSVSTRRC